ncbi:MAG: response regulator [Planctomycetes bacterium]|nr:response regulator [Planctomycetota bacterium]
MAYLMIVEDDEDFANAAATVLSHAGHEVAVHLDIDGARASMEERTPELVVLDVMFPEDASAGFELARAMHRPDSKLKDVPLIMLTSVNAKFPLGFSSHDIDQDWLPVSDFLQKPVDFNVLVSRVEALLQKSDSPASKDA